MYQQDDGLETSAVAYQSIDRSCNTNLQEINLFVTIEKSCVDPEPSCPSRSAMVQISQYPLNPWKFCGPQRKHEYQRATGSTPRD